VVLDAGHKEADRGRDNQPRHQHPHQAHLTGRAAEVIQLFPDLAGLVLEADLLLVVLLPLVADLVPIGHRAAGGAVQMVDGAVGIHLLPPGRAVIGPALRAAAVFLVVIALSAGLAVYRCHGVSSLSHIR